MDVKFPERMKMKFQRMKMKFHSKNFPFTTVVCPKKFSRPINGPRELFQARGINNNFNSCDREQIEAMLQALRDLSVAHAEGLLSEEEMATTRPAACWRRCPSGVWEKCPAKSLKIRARCLGKVLLSKVL